MRHSRRARPRRKRRQIEPTSKRPVPVPLHLAQEAARTSERRGEVLTQRLLPPLERELPHRDVLPRPDAVYRDADVDAPKRRAHLVEHALDLRLDREVGVRSECRRALPRAQGALLAAVVMHDEPRALGAGARAHAEPIPPEPPVISTPFP